MLASTLNEIPVRIHQMRIMINRGLSHESDSTYATAPCLCKEMPYLVRFSRSQIERMPGLCSLQM